MASKLIELIPDIGVKANTLTRKLNVYCQNQWTENYRTFTLTLLPKPENDDMTINDDILDTA